MTNGKTFQDLYFHFTIRGAGTRAGKMLPMKYENLLIGQNTTILSFKPS